MSQIGDGFVFVEKTDQENVFKTRQINIKDQKQAQQPQQEQKQAPLLEDGNLVSLAEENQAKASVFDKTRFVNNIKKLNKKARGVDPNRMAEKGSLVLDLYAIKKMKIKDSNGRNHKLPSDIRDVLKDLNDYTLISSTARDNANQRGYNKISVLWWAVKVALNITGSRSKITKEHELLASMLKKLDVVIFKYDHPETPEYSQVVKSLKELRTTLTMQSGGVRTKNKTADGRCKRKWRSYSPESRKINGVGRSITTTADANEDGMKMVLETNVTRDRSDWPLFSHRPSYEDICQGAAGNCFFLAALASIPAEKIREMMLDHGDGTVTVRFYDRNAMTGKREPVYVTVDKKVKINASLDCFWVQIMEKAYSLFRQTRSGNKMLLENEKRFNPDTGEEEGIEKTISENVIDLGYLSNGGQSRDVLSDFLGVESEYIDIHEATERKTLPQICRDALQQSDEEGAALLEIDRLKNRFAKMTRKLEKVLRRKGKTLEEFKNYETGIKNRKDTIKALEVKIQEDPTNAATYQRKIQENLERIEQEDKEMAPIKGMIYEYYNAKAQSEAQITAIMNKYGLKEKPEEGRHGPEHNDYGIQEELNAASQKVIDYLEKTGFYIGIQGEINTLKNGSAETTKWVLSNFIDEYIGKIASKRKLHVNTATLKDYELLIRDALNSVKEDSPVFVELARDTFKLRGVTNNNADIAQKITKEFMVPVLEKMLKNIGHVDGIERNLDYGEEDPIATYYFDKLTSMIKNKQSVCIGTKQVQGGEGGVAGEGLSKGMVGGHAYTVLDTKKTKDGAKLVKLRNTWAAYVVDYKQGKRGVLESMAVQEESSGIFWIEMNHLMQFLDDIHGSGDPNVA